MPTYSSYGIVSQAAESFRSQFPHHVERDDIFEGDFAILVRLHEILVYAFWRRTCWQPQNKRLLRRCPKRFDPAFTDLVSLCIAWVRGRTDYVLGYMLGGLRLVVADDKTPLQSFSIVQQYLVGLALHSEMSKRGS